MTASLLELHDDILRVIFEFLEAGWGFKQYNSLSIVNKQLNTLMASIKLQLANNKLESNYMMLRDFQLDTRLASLFYKCWIIIVGGVQNNRKCERLNLRNEKFTKCCGVSYKREDGFDCVFHFGAVFVLSGSDAVSVGSVERYDIIADKWSELAPFPRPLRCMAIVSSGDELYVTGGFDSAVNARSAQVYCFNKSVAFDVGNIIANAWALMPVSLLVGRSHHGCAGYKGKLWLVGGLVANVAKTTNSVEIYDPDLQQSTIGPALVAIRYCPRLLVVNGILYAVGGDIKDFTYNRNFTIEQYDEYSNRWKLTTSFPICRINCAVCAYGNAIYVFGGNDGFRDIFTWASM